MNQTPDRHIPVLRDAALDLLITGRSGVYFDGTLGDGGHSREIARRIEPDGRLISVDLDENAVNHASSWKPGVSCRVDVYRDNFSNVRRVLFQAGVGTVNGILLDLGLSSRQLDDAERGFSHRLNGPLDMRMNAAAGRTAADILNETPEKELADIFFRYGEERMSRKITRLIVAERDKKQFETTGEVVSLIRKRLHPSHFTKTLSRIFQALRIAVNGELDNLESTLETCWNVLEPGGRIVVISYHSLEDRMVKHVFRRHENPCVCPKEFPECRCGAVPDARVLTKKAVVPDSTETEHNPRARSAKMRAAERIVS